MKEQDIEQRPAWLKRMENGSVAEARTKALLMDRFWILERSVDIQGADFFIQRRITAQDLFDSDPPRLGVIQTKYLQSEKTNLYIHEQYVVNEKGEPREEFFLILHNGSEDKKRLFLLSSKDIKEELTLREYSKSNKFLIRGKDILAGSKYEIIVLSQALNRIEQSIRLADFAKNRKFISWALPSYSNYSRNDINSDYLVPLDNWWGDIPETFYKIKLRIEKLLFAIFSITEPLQTVLRSTDPLSALNILESLKLEMINNSGGTGFFFHADIYYQDFHDVVSQHQEKVALLRNKGLLDRFYLIQMKFEEYVCFDLAKRMWLEPHLAYTVNITYDNASLERYFFKSAIIPKDRLIYLDDTDDFSGVVNSTPGNITVFWVPGRLFCNEETVNWEKKIQDKLWLVRRSLMEEIYTHLE